MRKGIIGGLILWLIHNFIASSLVVSKNYGMSLGVPIDWYWLVIVVILVILMVKDKDWGWLMIIGGGVANLIDRLVFGYVRDYWKLPMVDVYNNVNDWLIFVGILWKMKWR